MGLTQLTYLYMGYTVGTRAQRFLLPYFLVSVAKIIAFLAGANIPDFVEFTAVNPILFAAGLFAGWVVVARGLCLRPRLLSIGGNMGLFGTAAFVIILHGIAAILYEIKASSDMGLVIFAAFTVAFLACEFVTLRTTVIALPAPQSVVSPDGKKLPVEKKSVYPMTTSGDVVTYIIWVSLGYAILFASQLLIYATFLTNLLPMFTPIAATQIFAAILLIAYSVLFWAFIVATQGGTSFVKARRRHRRSVSDDCVNVMVLPTHVHPVGAL